MTRVGYYYHLVNVISLSHSQSNHIKRLYILLVLHSFYVSVCVTKVMLCLNFCLSVCLPFCLCHLSAYDRIRQFFTFLTFSLFVILSILISVFLSFCLSVILSICLSVYLSICLSVFLSVSPKCLKLDHIS